MATSVDNSLDVENDASNYAGMVFTVDEHASHPNQIIGMLPKGKQGRQRKSSAIKRKEQEDLNPPVKKGEIAETPVFQNDDITREIDSAEHKMEDKLASQSSLTDDHKDNNNRHDSGACDRKSDIERLKQLLLLQVSLISRQQDLLRLRDREILQLKASNQNYKCQLNRIRRRMSTKKDSNAGEDISMVFSSNTSKSDLPSATRSVEDAGNTLASISNIQHGDSNHVDENLLHQTPSKCRRVMKDKATHDEAYQTDTQSSQISAQGSSYQAEETSEKIPNSNSKANIPVPLSFIERRQHELFSALITSPPDKALKNFCMIVDSPSPREGGDINLADFPFKICDRCPHCVAIATEITRLIKIAENHETSGLNRLKIMKSRDCELLKLASINPLNSDKDINGKGNNIMRTSVSYFRNSLDFDTDHWWWDLKCGNFKVEDKLNIPTWKEQNLLPLQVTDQDSDEGFENVDDSSYVKRHCRHELDEKRRKRWDIQRIREYRYTEKLRQKLNKQAAMYETPVIETFSGHLHDAESVEVYESLPVNVFGYPAPHIEPEEFSLTAMYPMTKIFTSGNRKRRSKNI